MMKSVIDPPAPGEKGDDLRLSTHETTSYGHTTPLNKRRACKMCRRVSAFLVFETQDKWGIKNFVFCLLPRKYVIDI